MEHAGKALIAVKLGTQHWDKIRDPARRRFDQMVGNVEKPDPHVIDYRTMEEKGYILRKRSEVQSDEEIVEVVRHRGQVLPRRPRNRRQISSVDGTRSRRGAGGEASDSEGSVPPRGRRARSSGRSKRGKSSSSSSASSSDLGSSTDEEKEIKRMRRKKWITAALASVATIHAASKVYSSIEKHDKRVIAVAKGELSPEEAHKQAKSAKWQDAAAIGIAALGIKGSISEWKEMKEEHEKHKELCEKHEEYHRKRLEHQRRKAAADQNGYYKGRDGEWYYDGPVPQNSQRSRSTGGYNSSRALDGPRQNERRMIEGPPPRDQDRDAYGRSRSRARSTRGRDDDSPSPVRARSRRGSPNRRVSAYDD